MSADKSETCCISGLIVVLGALLDRSTEPSLLKALRTKLTFEENLGDRRDPLLAGTIAIVLPANLHCCAGGRIITGDARSK